MKGGFYYDLFFLRVKIRLEAFDRMFRPRLLAKLRAMGISGRLFCFIAAFFSSRRQRVKVDGVCSEFLETRNVGLSLFFFAG